MRHRTTDDRPRARGPSPIPLVPRIPVSLADAETARLEAVARKLVADEPALGAVEAFGPGVRCGLDDGPLLLVGDHAGIALIPEESRRLYQHRMALLARDGDLVALSVNRDAAYEAYLDGTLGLGAPEYLSVAARAETVGRSLCRACAEDAAAFARIVGTARARGGLTIVPHIGSGHPWVLAAAVAKASARPVAVAAPPPRLTRRVNHKLWFSELVDRVLGRQAQPLSAQVFGPASLVGRLRLYAKAHDRLVVKVPDSAGSAGNIALRAREIDRLSNGALHRRLRALLEDLGWRRRYPLQAQVWDCSVRCTPSVQMWIPARADGPPMIEGIFEQVVEGLEAEFVGARPSELPQEIVAALAEEAFRLAVTLQACGYFGRCSFDSVIVGEEGDAPAIHWIECNGRWGGVSLPMTLVNRLAAPDARPQFVVVQREAGTATPLRTERVLEALSDRLYRPDDADQGVILLSPAGEGRGGGRRGGGGGRGASRIHFAALGATPAAAMAEARDAVDAISTLLTDAPASQQKRPGRRRPRAS